MLNWPGRKRRGGDPSGGESVSVTVSAVSIARCSTRYGTGNHGLRPVNSTAPRLGVRSVAMEIHQLQTGVFEALRHDREQPEEEAIPFVGPRFEGVAKFGGRKFESPSALHRAGVQPPPVGREE